MGTRLERDDILIAGPAWIGDMVMAQSLFMLLKDHASVGEIDVLAPRWSGPLLSRMPQVRNHIELDVAHGELSLGKRLKLGRSLHGRYQRSIVLPRSWKSALVSYIAGIPHRTGFLGEMRYGLLNDIRKLDSEALDQTVKRYLALGLPLGEELPQPPQPRLTVDEKNRDRLIKELELSGNGAAVSLMPGAAYGPAKCWPLEYFAELARQLESHGARVWVMGSEADRAAADAIVQGLPGAKNLCGLTRLEDTVDLFAITHATVTNDSGLMHVAAAAGASIVAIYGSTSPSFTPPLTGSKVVHHLGISCSPCFRRECPLEHLRCLKEISPETVFLSLEGLIA